MTEVIDISDGELEIQNKNGDKKFKCLNPECRSEENLIKATMANRKYYGVFSYPKKTRICIRCCACAKAHVENLVDSMRAGSLLLTNPIAERKNTVILSDSDSDPTDCDITSEESEYEYDEDELMSDSSPNRDGEDSHAKFDLGQIVSSICDKFRLRQQMEDGRQNVSDRLVAAEDGFASLNSQFRDVENEIGKLRNSFYNSFNPNVKWLPPLDIDPTGMSKHTFSEVTEILSDVKETPFVPPKGPLVRRQVHSGDVVFCMKTLLFSRWIKGVVTKIDRWEANTTIYKVNIVGSRQNDISSVRSVTGRNIAYLVRSNTSIPIGGRVIARYRDESGREDVIGEFYVGIIAEIPSCTNKYRYLIFFDDGYAQYVCHNDVRVVVDSSASVWEDVSPDSREFIKDYLQTYPERPMVRLQKHNYIKTECNGRWWKAQVLQVDASLVKMYFPTNNRTEWIYRGSTRLSPLFNKKMSIQSQTDHTSTVVRRRTMPYKAGPIVEYVNVDQTKELVVPTPPTERRAVARKSTSGRAGTPPREVQERIQQESKGVASQTALAASCGKFEPHQCSQSCLGNENSIAQDHSSSLNKPLLLNWRRMICREKKRYLARVVISYVAPCGRRLRSIQEVFRYLRLTGSVLEIDFFSFEIGVDPTTVWEPEKKVFYEMDISNGIEELPISAVNSLNEENPKELLYCNVRQPSKGVSINTEEDFLICCSCDDDCQDKSRCECWQLTFDNMIVVGTEKNTDVGYDYRRLHDQVATGIFECNSRCKCKRTCINRVVQNPIRHKLQLFNTARRGWAVRTLNDIPRGAFITVYVGRVLSENVANEEGRMTTGGDDYYAELDFIEVAEGMKEGYESDVDEYSEDKKASPLFSSEDSEEDSDPPVDEPPPPTNSYTFDHEFVQPLAVSSRAGVPQQRKPSARLTERAQKTGSSSATSTSTTTGPEDEEKNEEEENDNDTGTTRQPQNFEPRDPQKLSPQKETRNLRSHFGNDETVYIMDAKTTGNVGRYFNHSCQPNIFVQNAFVDTHDIRFPWIAFFAAMNIRAGAELTWDYNYEVGSVQGKIKYCYCMSRKCRGRLL